MSISRMVSMDVARVAEQKAKADPAIRPLDANALPGGSRSGPPMPPMLDGKPATAPAAGSNDQDAAASALDVLARYIPSEVIAIYIFGLSILDTVATEFSRDLAWTVLAVICLILVGLFVSVNWVVLKRMSDDPIDFPKWAFGAGLFSFIVWGMAIPGNPITEGSNVLSMLLGFAALVSSHVLLLFEKLVVDTTPQPG